MAAAPKRPVAAIARAVLPALIIAAVVALMILSGVARSRSKIRESRGRITQADDMLRGFGEQAARFLAARQAADGSWGEAPESLRILLNLRGTAAESEPFYRAGLDFARAQQRRALAWTRGERDERGAAGVEPTLETLASCWLLLGPGERPDEVAARLRAQETPRGLYRHRLAPGASRDADVRLPDNVLLLGVLPAAGLEPVALLGGLRGRMAEVGPLSAPERIALAHLASLAARAGAGNRAAAALRAEILARVDPAALEPLAKVDTPTLAAYVAARSEQCLLGTDPCNELNSAVGALAVRRQADGSWAGEGAVPETTSLGLTAIASYRRILAGRSDGTLGASAPGAAPRHR